MAKTALAVRRRAQAEQRALHLIRGGEESPEFKLAFDAFTRLRQLAERCDIRIQKPGTPFVSADEIQLLGWLAMSQRVDGYRKLFHADARFTLTIVNCGGLLEAVGMHLPPTTIYGARTHVVGAGRDGYPRL